MGTDTARCDHWAALSPVQIGPTRCVPAPAAAAAAPPPPQMCNEARRRHRHHISPRKMSKIRFAMKTRSPSLSSPMQWQQGELLALVSPVIICLPPGHWHLLGGNKPAPPAIDPRGQPSRGSWWGPLAWAKGMQLHRATCKEGALLICCAAHTCKEGSAQHKGPISVVSVKLLVLAPVDEPLSCGQVVVVAKDIVDVPDMNQQCHTVHSTNRCDGKTGHNSLALFHNY